MDSARLASAPILGLVISFGKRWLLCLCLLPGWLSAVEVRHARNFTIEEVEGALLLTVSQPWRGADDLSYRYLLYPRGTVAPSGYEGVPRIAVPVRRTVAMTTATLAQLDALGEVESLVAVGSFKHPNTPSVRELIDAGKLTEVRVGARVNIEQIIALEPDLILGSALGVPGQDSHPQLIEAGEPVVLLAGYMEGTPLGRAEWIKFLAAFYGKEKEAERYFETIERRYTEAVALCRDVKERPRILMNAPWGGTWHIPGADSYKTQLILDAGGDCLFPDVGGSGAEPLDFELIYKHALQADIWINPSQFEKLDDLLRSDARYADFPAVQSGRVFNQTARLNAYGGNDVWERGVLHPEEVLRDLIHCFHPDLLPDYEPIFYERLR